MNRISSYAHRVATALRLRGPLVGDVRARTLHGLVVGLLLYIWVVHIPIIVPLFVARKADSTLANLYLTLIYGITLALLRRGSLRRASVLYLAGTWVAASVFVVFGGGIQSTALVHYVNLPILAAWLLGTSAAGVVTAVCLGSSLILAVLQQSGYALPHYFPGAPFGNWSSVAMAMVGAVVPVLFVLKALNEALERRRGAEEELRHANEKLEQRVRERTAQLEEANDFLQIHLGEQKRLEAGLELAARFPGENPNPVMRLGHGHLVDFANPAAKALLRTLGCAVAGEAPAHIAEPAVAALKDGVPRQIEQTYSERTYLFSLAPIPQWDYVNLYATDITDRKRAEEALRKSESQYRALFEHMSEGLAYCRMICENGDWRDFVYLAVNGTFETLTGLQNVVGRRVSELIPGIQASDPGLFEAYARVALTGKPEKFETFVEALGMWYSVSAYSPEKEYFVAVFEVITERKRAEDALRKSEERFRGLSEAMPLIVWTADATGARDYYNPRALEYAGASLSDLTGWNWTSIIHPEDQKATLHAWRQAIATGQIYEIEHRLRRADGEFRWHLTRGVPLRNEKGEVVQWIGSSTDIHDRKMAEQELERRVAERTAELARSTALLETVTANAPVILFATDAKGTFTVHTGQAVTASGQKPGELVGKNCRELLPERAQAVEHIHRALAGDTFTAVPEGPHDSTFETRYKPLRDAHGNVTGMIAVAVDITEARRAKDAIEKANAYNRNLLEVSLDPLVTISPNGKITDVNTATEKVTGCLREELIGADFSDYFTDPEKARLGYQQVFKEGLVQDYELEVRHRDGSTTPVLYNASVYRDQGGEMVGVFAAARDITTRKRAESGLRRVNRALRILSSSNQALVRTQNESQLPQEICRILVEEGGYRMAWMGFAEHDAAKSLRPVASAGVEEGYLAAVKLTWADTERGQGPGGVAVRTGQPAVCNNIMEDPQFSLWREDAAQRGYASTCVLPMKLDDQTMAFLAVYSPVPDAFDAAEVKLLTELADDITFGFHVLHTRAERQQAEEALKAERQRFFAVLETLPPMICLLTADYHVAFANRAFRERYGEARGRRCYDYCFGNSTPCEFCQTYDVLKTGLAHHWEVSTPEGSVIDVYDFPFTDVDGTPMILEMELDITEAKRAKEALEKANAYNRNLLEVSLDPLVTISPNGEITDVNTATEKVTGRLREELIGADFSDYFTDPEKARLGYQQVFKEGLVQDYELEVRHRDGSTTPVLYNASVYRDQGGEVVGVFAAARDITTRKRAEEEVRRLNEDLEQRVRLRTAQLEASIKELESFSYSVSHDLRAPLRAMDGFSRILLEEYRSQLPSKAQRYLDFVRGGAAHMGDLIDGLLALSRLGRQELKRRPVEVAEIVKQSMDDLRAEVEGSGAEFVVGRLPSCDADPLLLRQVFVNLLSNALKFSRKQEKVRIEFGALRAHEAAQAPVEVLRLVDPHTWIYYVRDNGVGFDMRYADKLFGVFQRLHRQEDFKGTGIGLATVQQIIHRHGGQVWAEAEVGKGATFYFTVGPSQDLASG